MTGRRIIATMILCLSLSGLWQAGAQISQRTAIEYAKSAMKGGMSSADIKKELSALGLSTADLAKLQSQYGEELEDIGLADTRSHELNDEYADPDDTTAVSKGRMLKVKTPEDTSKIFGHNIFSSKRLTFEPNENMATPEDYKLGPGDQVIIDIWGASEASTKQTVSPEGSIIIPHVGQVQLGGLTIKAATQKIRKAVSARYSGIEGSNPASDISVTLGKIRTIQVSILGEVKAPGTYRLSSLTSLFNAIYRAGGVTELGTLRAVKVVRSGETVATVDIYNYLFNGDRGCDIPLKEGDAVIVPPYISLVTVDGSAKRPMMYELVEGETAGRLLEYAGGFAGDAYKSEVSVLRSNGREHEIFTVASDSFDTFTMADGDTLRVGQVIDRTANQVELQGAVYRPGFYEVGGSIATVRQLINHAEGLREDAYMDRAIIYRELPDLTKEVIPLDLKGIMDGTADDVILRRNDVISISAVNEMREEQTVTIMGSVRLPATYAYSENTSVEDLIYMAGGLLDGASTIKVDIARRVNDPESDATSDVLTQSFTVDVKNGLLINPKPFILKPFDVVSVRNNPVYNVQKMVTIEGEIAFEGDYAVLNTDDRISDLIERAGGLTPRAHIEGARLLRKLTDDEKDGIDASLKMIRRGGLLDTLAVADTLMESYYSVGVQLDKAMKHKGSDYDIVLKDGDRIQIPEYTGTVKIQGEVMYPNTVSYVSGKPLSYYISQAGGFSTNARRRNVYVVNANGTVSRLAGSTSKIEPGSEIFVPARPDRDGMSLTEILSLSTSTASLATMILAIIRYL